MSKKILVIEDETHLALGILFNLKREGHLTELAVDGIEALEKWQSFGPDLILLDIMLPKIDGLTLLKKFRELDKHIPILILSAKNQLQDRIQSYNLGVDDYLCKPFDLEELLLKIKVLLKRSDLNAIEGGQESSSDAYQFGSNTIYFDSRIAQTPQGEIHLTEQEVKLLRALILNEGKVLDREKLLTMGWNLSAETKSRTVDNFMVRMRKYFEKDPKNPTHFLAFRGRGYLFRSTEEVVPS